MSLYFKYNMVDEQCSNCFHSAQNHYQQMNKNDLPVKDSLLCNLCNCIGLTI